MHMSLSVQWLNSTRAAWTVLRASRDQRELVITHIINIRLATKPDAAAHACIMRCTCMHGDCWTGDLKSRRSKQDAESHRDRSILENQISSEMTTGIWFEGQVPAWHCPNAACKVLATPLEVYSLLETYVEQITRAKKQSIKHQGQIENKSLTHLSKISRATNTCLTFHVRRIIATTDHQLCQRCKSSEEGRGPGPRAGRPTESTITHYYPIKAEAGGQGKDNDVHHHHVGVVHVKGRNRNTNVGCTSKARII